MSSTVFLFLFILPTVAAGNFENVVLHLSEKARVQGTGRARLASRNPAQASEGEGPEKLLPSGLSVDGLRSTADTPAEDRIWTLQAFKKDVNK